MGKMSEALEKHQKEMAVKTESLGEKGQKEKSSMDPALFRTGKMSIGQGVDPNLLVVTAPDSLDAENFKTLRGQIFSSKNGTRPRIIMVASAYPGEGKTFVAANLAASIAMGIDEHVLLVDCDLRRPCIHKMFGYANKEGLHEYLSDKRSLSDLIVKTKIEKLSFLPAGAAAPNPTELLASKSMADFLEEIKERYDDRVIVIDSTPSQITAEAKALAPHVDGIVFVIFAERASKGTINKAIENLGKEKILGIIFNGYQKAYREYSRYYKRYY